MPMTASRVAFDPYAALSWIATIAVLAMQKLRRSVVINDREKKALLKLADQLELLSRASEISLEGQEALLPTSLRQSFFTLVAIGERSTQPGRKIPSFGKTGQDLRYICINAESTELNAAVLDSAQKVCIELLEHLNDQRPRNTVG